MGKLYFYYSAMNAGKTTTLLQSSFNYNERGMKTLLFTPSIDDRYQIGYIKSRIGLEAKATSFDIDFNFMQYYDGYIDRGNPKVSCILGTLDPWYLEPFNFPVDEAQFLTKSQVEQLSDIVDKWNIPVLAYGLRSDFRSEPFEGSKYLLAWADEINEIKTICHCGRKATFNARIDRSSGKMLEYGEQIVIGGNDTYVSLCRKHFKTKDLGDKTLEEARVSGTLYDDIPHAELVIQRNDSGISIHKN